jgi:hypothetical protein
VDGGNNAAFPVGEKQGKTIRGLDDEEKAGFLRDQRVPRRAVGQRSVDDMDDVGVDLVEEDGMKTPRISEGPKIVFGKFARSESVNQAGDPREKKLATKFSMAVPLYRTSGGF